MMSNASDKGQEILIMNIDIGDGRYGQITVHEEDEPEDLAAKFCQEHGLDAQLKQALVTQIEQHIDELVQEQQVSTLDEENEAQVVEPRKEMQPQFSHQPVINANSRAMAKGRDQMNVYDRLHSLAKKPRAAPEPEVHPIAEPKRLSPSKVYPFKNPGHKLYYKGLKMKEDTEVQCVQIKQIQQTQQEQELTFKPQINPNSAKLAKRTGSARPEDALLRKGLQSKEAIARKREEKDKQAMQNCKFVPGIDKRCFFLRSSRIGTKVVRSRSQDAFQGLYEEAQKRKERHEQTFSEIQNSECPFRPKVNEVLRSKFSGTSFLERQVEYQKANEESMELCLLYRERSRLYDNKDPTTGQELFKPRTGRSPRRLAARKRLKTAQEPQSELFPSVEMSASKTKSEQLLLKRKIERFQEIFAELRPDEMGYISAHRIIVEDVDRSTLRTIAPVLEELESLDQTLNFPEFVDAMEELMKTLTPGEKAEFLDYRKKPTPSDSQNTFAPAIRPYKFSPSYETRAQMPLYDRLLSYQQAVDSKVQTEKEHQMRKELANCPFKPSIIGEAQVL